MSNNKFLFVKYREDKGTTTTLLDIKAIFYQL